MGDGRKIHVTMGSRLTSLAVGLTLALYASEVNGRYGERQEGKDRNDRQTLAWKNKHI
jgi:hypothetical protein